jgi:hypothetical protein
MTQYGSQRPQIGGPSTNQRPLPSSQCLLPQQPQPRNPLKSSAIPLSTPREHTSCQVRYNSLANIQAVARHMQRWHPVEWANPGPGRQVIYYPCDVPGCNMLGNNTRYDH